MLSETQLRMTPPPCSVLHIQTPAPALCIHGKTVAVDTDHVSGEQFVLSVFCMTLYCHHVTCHVSCQLSCHMLSRVQDLRTASHTLPEQCYYPFLISAAGWHTGRCLHNPRQPSNKLSLVPGMYLDSVDISRYHGWLSPGYLSPVLHSVPIV